MGHTEVSHLHSWSTHPKCPCAVPPHTQVHMHTFTYAHIHNSHAFTLTQEHTQTDSALWWHLLLLL